LQEVLPSALDGHSLLIAFSGGPDSLALLLAASRLATRSGLRVVAAHLDHRLDPGSAQRAERAQELAKELETPFLGYALAQLRPRQQSREVFARQARYDFLAAAAQKVGSSLIATAHHADDQAETVLLRLLFGSGLEGLAGIAARRQLGSCEIIRPLLGLRRGELREYVDAAGLVPIEDPTNLDLQVPRNRVRHRLLPKISAAEGSDPTPTLCALAQAGRRSAAQVSQLLARSLEAEADQDGARISRLAFEKLPDVLHGPALSLLHRLAGEAQPAPLEARRELLAQLRRGGKVRCDCGGRGGRFFYWQANRQYILLRRSEGSEPKPGQFTYTFEASGTLPLER